MTKYLGNAGDGHHWAKIRSHASESEAGSSKPASFPGQTGEQDAGGFHQYPDNMCSCKSSETNKICSLSLRMENKDIVLWCMEKNNWNQQSDLASTWDPSDRGNTSSLNTGIPTANREWAWQCPCAYPVGTGQPPNAFHLWHKYFKCKGWKYRWDLPSSTVVS